MSDNKQSANEELRNALRLCMRGMCGYCRMDAEARGMSTECVNGCEALKVAKAALDRNPVEANKEEMRDTLLAIRESHSKLETAHDVLVVRTIDRALAVGNTGGGK